MSAILEIRSASCGYNDGPDIIRNISLKFVPGSRTALIGPNGSGKTTLEKTLLGLLYTRSGAVYLDGVSITTLSRREIAEKIAYVPQPAESGLQFSVEDFVMMGRYSRHTTFGGECDNDRRAVLDAMELTDTLKFAKRRHDSLSGGERQKVMLAAAIAQDSEIMLLDEPSAFLDPMHRIEIDEILLNLNKRHGKTVIFATHDINQAALSCDRMIGLKDGKVVCDSTPNQIMKPEILRELYGIDFTMIPHPFNGLQMILPSPPEVAKKFRSK